MFVNWLLTVFPVELRAGWNRLRPQILLWAALAMLPALLAAFSESRHESPTSALTILQAVGLLLVTFLVATMLDAGERGRGRSASALAALLVSRGLPLAAFAIIAALFTYVPQRIALYAAELVLRGTPLGHVTAVIFSDVIYVSLLARVCFVPFLVVLHGRAELRPDALPTGWLRVPATLVWPLIASDTMSDGRRWRIAPYLVLPYLAPIAVLLVPAGAAQLGMLVLTEMFKLTCLAVLFGHFVECRPRVLVATETSQP